MKAEKFLFALAAVSLLSLADARYVSAQTAPTASPSACGVDNAKFKTKRDGSDGGMTAPPAGKALVYVIEQMPGGGVLTTHLKVGADGHWLAQLNANTFISFVVDPGVHHLCVTYQGQLAPSQLGQTILHRLNAEAGKTYYMLYRGLITKDAGELGFFEEVDADEGSYALQSSDHVTSTETKK